MNVGTGTMVVSNITSNDSTVIVYPTSFFIEEGAASEITVTYTPEFSGNLNSIITIYSNDPNNPEHNVYINGNAVSEISGDFCGILSSHNSPYYLTGDIFVPDTCILTIETGVKIYGYGHGIYVDGTLNAIDLNKIVLEYMMLFLQMNKAMIL